MALTLQAEIDIANAALDRLAAGNITLAVQTFNEALVVNRHYPLTLDSLLRSFLWPFAKKEVLLERIEVLELDAAPAPAAFAVGAVITGDTSGETATILSVISTTEYEIIDRSGDFDDAEDLVDDAVTPNTASGAAGYPDVSDSTPLTKWTFQYLLPTDFSRIWNIYEDDGIDHENDRWVRQGLRILTDYSTVNLRYIRDITDPAEFDPLFTEVLILRLALKMISPLVGTKSSELKAELKDELRLAEKKAMSVCAQEVNTSGRQNYQLARFGASQE